MSFSLLKHALFVVYLTSMTRCYVLNKIIQVKSVLIRSTNSNEFDPNFSAHLPSLLKKGTEQDRSSPELAKELRKKYLKMSEFKRKASKTLQEINPELAIELDELALEIEETSESFINIATAWDAWSRPSPDLANELRAQKQTVDPNFEAHLKAIYLKGQDPNRPSADLPTELRMLNLKKKNIANVSRILSKTLKDKNTELAAELSEISDEISESVSIFEAKANAIKDKKY